MDIDKLQEPLKANEIEFRVQSINKGGYATILAYKDARTDINRLNAICGRLGWERKHTRENHNCIVSIWDADHNHWVSKEDTGTESNTEAQKGLASDSFKRACFNWGIGIELYDFPVIQVKLIGDKNNPNSKTDEFKMVKFKDKFGNDNEKAQATWNLRLKEWAWFLESNADGSVKVLAARDQKGNPRFSYKENTK